VAEENLRTLAGGHASHTRGTLPTVALLKHELWESPGRSTYCLAGPDGDSARALLEPGARLVWTTMASSHFEAMTRYYAHRKWGTYTTMYEQDHDPYTDEMLRRQRSVKGMKKRG
jgi:lauroyl/myristoyl acyltransferase